MVTAHAPLAEAWMRFHATHQGVAMTRERCDSGECWVLTLAGRLIGTATFKDAGRAPGTPHPGLDDRDGCLRGYVFIEHAPRDHANSCSVIMS